MMLDQRKEHRRLKLKQLIERKFGGNQAAFSKAAQIAPTLVSRYLSGKKGIGEEMRDKIEENTGYPEWLDAPLEWGQVTENQLSAKDVLATYDTDDKQRNAAVEGKAKERRHTISHRTEIEIPQYETGGAMGYGGLVLGDQPGIIHNWSVNREWIEKNVRGYTSIANLCIVTGFGPSMIGMFNPGDPLIVDRGYKTCDVDAPYFFRIGEHGFIKILQRIPRGGSVIIRAKSKNPDYDPFDIDETMDFEIIGRVLRAWVGNDY